METNNKKGYWWIKLQNDFFERDEIKLIESVPDGSKYIVFYIRLLLKSTDTNGYLVFRDVIPYTEEMLAAVTKTDITTVKYAIDLFLKLGLMEKINSGTFHMLELEKMVGAETEHARKKREYREKLKIENKEKTKEDITKTKEDIVRQESRDKSIELRQQQSKECEKEIVVDVNLSLKKWNDFSESEKEWALQQASPTAKNKIAVALTLLRTGVKPPVIKKCV